MRFTSNECFEENDYDLGLVFLPVVAIALNYFTLVNWRDMRPITDYLVRANWWADLARDDCAVFVAGAGLVILSKLKLKDSLKVVLSGVFLFLFLTNLTEFVFMLGSLLFPGSHFSI